MPAKSDIICAEIQQEELNMIRISPSGKVEKFVHEPYAPILNPIEALLNRIEFNFGKEAVSLPLKVVLTAKSNFQISTHFSSSVGKTKELKKWFASVYLGDGSENYRVMENISSVSDSQAKVVLGGIRKEELQEISAHFKTWGVFPHWIDLKTVALSNLFERVAPQKSGILFHLGENEISWFEFVEGNLISWAPFRIKTNSTLKDAIQSQISKYGFEEKAFYTSGVKAKESDVEELLRQQGSSFTAIDILADVAGGEGLSESLRLAGSLAYSLHIQGDQ